MKLSSNGERRRLLTAVRAPGRQQKRMEKLIVKEERASRAIEENKGYDITADRAHSYIDAHTKEGREPLAAVGDGQQREKEEASS